MKELKFETKFAFNALNLASYTFINPINDKETYHFYYIHGYNGIFSFPRVWSSLKGTWTLNNLYAAGEHKRRLQGRYRHAWRGTAVPIYGALVLILSPKPRSYN